VCGHNIVKLKARGKGRLPDAMGKHMVQISYLASTGVCARRDTAMPIRSQRLPMRFEDWELLPYQPGWKYEYWGGCAHITPNHQTAVTVAPVTPRQVTAPCVIRPVCSDDEAPLLAVYLAAFAENQAFCDCTDAQMLDAARRDLRESFTGRRAPLLAAARVAVATDTPDASRVGAALLSRDREYGPVLDLLFIHPTWHRRGLATALVASAMNALYQAAEQTLTSVYQLANPNSQAWHRAFGFVELPDLRYAQAYYRCARQELFRHEQQGLLTVERRAALQAEVEQWRVRVEELERLEETQGYHTVFPRRPHW
jgi:GNAT superfamily N-acetyltransferase